MTSQADKVEAFRRLHGEGCFVMPNPWDVGTAVALEQMGFAALATTSAGHAWSLARPDNSVQRDEALEHLRQIAGAVDVPVNADFEHGFARDPDGVAVNVQLAAATGIASLPDLISYGSLRPCDRIAPSCPSNRLKDPHSARTVSSVFWEEEEWARCTWHKIPASSARLR